MRTIRFPVCSKLTPNQKEYDRLLKYSTKPLHVVHGVAGTGKTSIACEGAMFLLRNHPTQFQKLVITQPLTTVSGESVGYLPGDLWNKTAPWSRTMNEYLSVPYEFATLGHMRGITWNHTILIADEMQNATTEQMKALLTRVGHNTKLVVMGDLGQQDVCTHNNGFLYLTEILTELSSDMYNETVLNLDDVCRSAFVKELMKTDRFHR